MSHQERIGDPIAVSQPVRGDSAGALWLGWFMDAAARPGSLNRLRPGVRREKRLRSTAFSERYAASGLEEEQMSSEKPPDPKADALARQLKETLAQRRPRPWKLVLAS